MARVRFIIPAVLASVTGGSREVEVEASTVREAVASLASSFGEEFKRRVLEPNGEPKRLLNLYVNGKNIRFLSQLETELSDGDEVVLLPAVGGG